MRTIVVVGDIVASRRIVERSAVQEKLKGCFKKLNAGGRGSLRSPYTITLGDEFQAVFSRPDTLFRDALKILIAIHPVPVRFSYGVGALDTPINPKHAIGMDGPAFHHARSGMEKLKETKNLLTVSGNDAAGHALSNLTLALVSHMIRKWQRSRLEILLGLYEQNAVKEIAQPLGVTDKAVYKAIEAGAMRTIVQLFEQITSGLKRTLEQP